MSIIGNFRHANKFFAVRNLSSINLSNNMSGVGKTSQGDTTKDPMPDEQLVNASQQGDTKAFEVLVLRYQRQIFSLIYQMTHDVEVVEDIAQDVFLAAFKAIKNFKGKSSFFTWLYRITINHCKNYLSSSTRTQDGQQRYQKEHDSKEFWENQERNPENMLLTKEFIEQMEEAIVSLPEEQRVVLTLCEFEGLSYQEIAEVLECPIGTVRSRLSRARATLQEALSDFL